MPAPTSKPGRQRAELRHLAVSSRALIDRLDHLYPAAPPSLTDSDREVWFKAGARSVVAHLMALIRESDERGNVLEE